MESLRKQLENGQALIGLSVTYPVPGVIEQIGPDWDWIWIDSQHGQHDYVSILNCVRAADLVGSPSIVRVPDHDYGVIGRALDTDASGVMAPMVNNAEQAEAVARAAKFAPVGLRSYGGRRVVDLGGLKYAHTANEDTVLVAQIETPEALANVDEIAAVPGIDVLFLGPADVSICRGLRMDESRPTDFFDPELKQIVSATRKHDKFAGAPFGSPEAALHAAELGVQLIGCASDSRFLGLASKQYSEALGR